MDLRLGRKANEDFVVIRSSSCVIKIRETSSVYNSCISDSSQTLSNENQIFREVGPRWSVENRGSTANARMDLSRDDEAAVRSSPVPKSVPVDNTPEGILKLISSSAGNVRTTRHQTSECEITDVLVIVLNELKLYCKNIFEKSDCDQTDNPLRCMMRECFSNIIAKYSTDSNQNSYNRQQKMISRTIKKLTLECVDIIDRSICQQASVAQNDLVNRENKKSVLVKIMENIQEELNRSKVVLKIVNTELNQPSFTFIFCVLKYFIERAAVRFKSFSRELARTDNNHATNIKGAGEVSDSSCNCSDTCTSKLDEYASRLDRLLEKMTSDDSSLQSTSQQIILNCFHCTTKCEEQDLLLKTVTRFTEEIKQELINHTRVIREGSCYSRHGMSIEKNSRDLYLRRPEMSLVHSRTGVQGDFRSTKSNSTSPETSPVRNTSHQPRRSVASVSYPGKLISRNRNSQSPNSLSQGSKTIQTVTPHQHNPNTCTQRTPLSIQNSKKSPTREQRSFMLPSPACLHKHTLPASQCTRNPQSPTLPVSTEREIHLYKPLPSTDGTSTCNNHNSNGCRYCSSAIGKFQRCPYDGIKIEDLGTKVKLLADAHIYEANVSNDNLDVLPKAPVEKKGNLWTGAEHLHRIFTPKEEQVLVSKSKPKGINKTPQGVEPEGNGNDVSLVVNKDPGGSKTSKKASISLKRKNQTNTNQVKESSSVAFQGEEKVSITPDTSANLKNMKQKGTPLKDSKKKKENDKKARENEIEVPQKTETTTRERGNIETRKAEEPLLGASARNIGRERSKLKDPAHCCRMNCNCRNRRGEGNTGESIHFSRKDSINQTDAEPYFQQHLLSTTCCRGCNCNQDHSAEFMRGCTCRSGEAKDGGNNAIRPIYQFFPHPIPFPCKCQESNSTKVLKETQTSSSSTPKSGRGEPLETGTQTSKKQLSITPSQSSSRSKTERLRSAHSSTALNESAPSSSAPTSSTASSGYSTHSEPQIYRSNTTQPSSTTSSRPSKSDSELSCTCSSNGEKLPSQCVETQTSKAILKDVCTSDINCSCPESIEKVFQEFDDKYSQVVKEIKLLIKDGYLPLSKEEFRELNVTASTRSPTGNSVKRATCRCNSESCKRCRGSFEAQVTTKTKPNNFESELNENCEEELTQSRAFPKTVLTRIANNEIQPKEYPSQYASKDTIVYNDLQKEIQDLKELVKKSRFGNCPCCKCCKCDPDNKEMTCTNDPSSLRSQDSLKNKTASAQSQKEPLLGAKSKSRSDTKKSIAGTKGPTKQASQTDPLNISEQSGQIQPPGGFYFGTMSAGLRKQLSRSIDQMQVASKSHVSAAPTDGVTLQHRTSSTVPQEKHPSRESNQRRLLESGTNQDKEKNGSSSGKQSIHVGSTDDTQSQQAFITETGKKSTTGSGALLDESSQNKTAEDFLSKGSVLPVEATVQQENSYEKQTVIQTEPDYQAMNRRKSSSLSTAPSIQSADNRASTSTSGILKAESSKDKEGKSSSSKTVEIDPKIDSAGGRGDDSSPTGSSTGDPSKGDDDAAEEYDPDKELSTQKSKSNVSFGSKRSAGGSTSSRNLLSPEQEELLRSRERVREFNQFPQEPSAEKGRTEREPWQGLQDESDEATFGTFAKGFDRKDEGPYDKKEKHPYDKKDKDTYHEKGEGTADKKGKDTHDKKDDPKMPKIDSDFDSNGESVTDICRTLLAMDPLPAEPMPCSIWTNGKTSICHGLDTELYVMILESEATQSLATEDASTFFISDNSSKDRKNNSHIEENSSDETSLKERSWFEKSFASDLIKQTSTLDSKCTSALWKSITSPFELIKDLCKGPASRYLTTSNGFIPGARHPHFPTKGTRKISKRLMSPLNVSSHYSIHRRKMPSSKDSKRRRREHKGLKGSCRKNDDDDSRTFEDKEVQVTKWNAMTQTAGPRKFNRTDIPEEMEDKLARYLGLERTAENCTFNLSTRTTNSSQKKYVKHSPLNINLSFSRERTSRPKAR